MSVGNQGEPQIPTALGVGYDSFRSVVKPVVAVTLTASHPQTRTSCKIKICEGIQELNDTLEISAAASAGIPGVAKIEAKVEFVRDLKVTSRTVTMVIHAQRFDLQQVETASLAVQAPSSVEEALAFYQRNGDSYTSMIEKGSEYIAVYSFFSETTQEVESVKGTLSASGIVDGVEITGELGTKISTAVMEMFVETRFNQTLLGHAHLALPQAADICPFALRFVSLTPDNPVVTGFGESGYEQLFANRACFQTIIDNRKTLEDSDNGIALMLTKRYEILNQALWIRDAAYKAYGYTGDTELNSKISILNADKLKLKNWLAEAAHDPTKLVAKPTIQSDGWGIPRLSFTPKVPKSLGTWGHEYDTKTAFSDNFSASSPWAIRSIRIKGMRCVDKLEITYGALEIGAWGDATHNVIMAHGGDGGSWSDALNFEFGEYITKIAGTTNKHGEVAVTQLVITTSKGQSLKYPTDPWSSQSLNDQQFDQASHLLVGFSGQTGDYLNLLRGSVIQLVPAIWS